MTEVVVSYKNINSGQSVGSVETDPASVSTANEELSILGSKFDCFRCPAGRVRTSFLKDTQGGDLVGVRVDTVALADGQVVLNCRAKGKTGEYENCIKAKVTIKSTVIQPINQD